MFANVFSVGISKVLILCLLSFNIFGQSFSENNPDIHIISGTVVVFDGALKLPVGSSGALKSKIYKAKKRSSKEKSLSDRLRDKNFKKKAEKVVYDKQFLATGSGSIYTFGISRSSSSMAVLSGGYGLKFLLLKSLFSFSFHFQDNGGGSLFSVYDSFSLDKISIFFCCRPPPILV
ncbi:MAG: hypothetical protein E2590_18895 [Chryseobacterium sp.]|uniref:hypothetical protein n=1 Tax=Epilithonimonas caeni TaxID=365343 RepID=UPI0004888B6D|nr:hypothetical protein [Epilithonimonas caeni]MPS75190.1 hypothetical protein [Chryseobacterium sp.]